MNFPWIAQLNKIRKKENSNTSNNRSCYVDAKQYHLDSFSTRNSTLNTSLCKPIRMQDFIQLCDSYKNAHFHANQTHFHEKVLHEHLSWNRAPRWMEMNYCFIKLFNWEDDVCILFESKRSNGVNNGAKLSHVVHFL